MPRYTRDTAVLAKIETTYGTDAVPSGGANAILTSNPSINPLVANNVDRALVRPYFGASEQLVGTRYVQVSFTVELVGSGSAGVPPAFGPLLRACAMAEVITAGTRVDYTPITNNQEALTLYYYDSGVLHKLLGARGTVQIKALSGERPELQFTFQGLDGGVSTATPSGVDFSGFKTPLVVTDANTGDVTLGGTVAATGAPAIAGGTAVPSMGLELDLGGNVQFNPLLGGQAVDITGRELSGKMRLDLTAAQEVAGMDIVLQATLSSVSLLHGAGAGLRTLIHMPSVQRFEPAKDEVNGRRVIGYSLRGVPNPAGTGNDELRLVFF